MSAMHGGMVDIVTLETRTVSNKNNKDKRQRQLGEELPVSPRAGDVVCDSDDSRVQIIVDRSHRAGRMSRGNGNVMMMIHRGRGG